MLSAAGRLKYRIGQSYPLSEVAQAHRDLEAETTGCNSDALKSATFISSYTAISARLFCAGLQISFPNGCWKRFMLLLPLPQVRPSDIVHYWEPDDYKRELWSHQPQLSL